MKRRIIFRHKDFASTNPDRFIWRSPVDSDDRTKRWQTVFLRDISWFDYFRRREDLLSSSHCITIDFIQYGTVSFLEWSHVHYPKEHLIGLALKWKQVKLPSHSWVKSPMLGLTGNPLIWNLLPASHFNFDIFITSRPRFVQRWRIYSARTGALAVKAPQCSDYP
jgi:hypothetical protein